MADPSAPADERPPGTLVRVLGLVAVLALVVIGSALVKDRMDDDGGGTATTTAGAGDGDGTAGGITSTTVPSTTVASSTSTPTAPPAESTTTAPTTTTIPTGIFVTTPGTGLLHGTGPVHTYRTEVEEGTGVDALTFGAAVDTILADPRGWTATDGVSFQRVEGDSASFTVTLATPATTDQICLPLRTNGIFSCREGNRAVINLRRWMEGTTDLPLPVEEYRAAVINHEVGHVLGKGHVGCGGPGLAAPVMMQQSKGLAGCRANPWPTLDGT